jgi:uncharacterized repeat protein (TIGR01451 family)
MPELATSSDGEFITPPGNSNTLGPPSDQGAGVGDYPQLLGPTQASSPELAAPLEQVPSGSSAQRGLDRADGTFDQQRLSESPSASSAPAAFNPDPEFPTSSMPASDPIDPFNRGRVDSPQLATPGQPASLSEGGNGTPGSASLEGAQSPQLTIQKFAPAGIRVGEPAIFRIIVRNSGGVAAHDVEVQDRIPRGTQLLDAKPSASRGVSGELVWSLGTMNPGDETTLEIQLMPIEEGEIGSVATVHFGADASAKTIATKPELVVETVGPREVLIGDEVVLNITITNPGSGIATGVVIEERVPPGLQHPAGSELEYEVGDLKPNESRQIELRMTAERPGPATNLLVARADANLKVQDQLDIEVLSPDLTVDMEGPSRRYLDREASYTLSVENPGTAPAENVDLVAHLPHGLKFLSANHAGYYDEAKRTVRWRLEKLPVGEVGSVNLTTIPIETGEHSLRFVSSTPSGLSAEKTQSIQVEGIAAILFEVVDVEDPIERGGQTVYEIRVVNQGSKAATNVRLAAALPPQMQPVAAEGPPGVNHSIEGNNVLYESLARLAPKADTTYRIRVKGLEPGDLRINVQLIADELQDWVTKQESTRVYADE